MPTLLGSFYGVLNCGAGCSGFFGFVEGFFFGGGATAIGAKVTAAPDQRHKLFWVLRVRTFFDQRAYFLVIKKTARRRKRTGFSDGG